MPLDSLRWLTDFMSADGANHFRAAIRLMSHGLNVLLLTDFKGTFHMAADVDISDLLYNGLIRNDEPEAFVLLKVNPIVNRILGCLKEPVELKIDLTSTARSPPREGRPRWPRPTSSILKLIRSGDYEKVIVHLRNGGIVRADAENGYSSLSRDELIKLLDERDFQHVSVTMKGGGIANVQSRDCEHQPPRPTQDAPDRRQPQSDDEGSSHGTPDLHRNKAHTSRPTRPAC